MDNELDAVETEPQTDVSATDVPSSDTNELEDLLREFDTKTAPSNVVQQTQQPTTTENDEYREFMREYYRKEAKADLDRMVSRIQKDKTALSNVDADVIEHFLNGEAARDQKLVNAYRERNIKPKAWNKIVDKLGDKLVQKLGLDKTADAKVNRDRAAVAEALNGTSLAQTKQTDRAAENARIINMSPNEFAQWQRTHGITV